MVVFDEAFLGMLTEIEETVVSFFRFTVDGTIAVKKVRGREYVYIQRRKSGKWFYQYLGPFEDERVKRLVESLKKQKEFSLNQRKRIEFFVNLLKGAGVIFISGLLEKVVQRLSRSGVIFGRGILIGTLAFLSYQCKLGFSAVGKSGRTGDVDVVGDREVCFVVKDGVEKVDVLDALGNLKKEFIPESPSGMGREIPVRLVHPSGLRIDFLYPHKAGPPGRITGEEKTGFTGVGAVELPYLDLLIEEPITGILVGSRFLYPVTVPVPERFVAHKLIIAGRRKRVDKAIKDVLQVETLLEVMKARGVLSFVKEEAGRYFTRYRKSKRYFEKTLRILEERGEVGEEILSYLKGLAKEKQERFVERVKR